MNFDTLLILIAFLGALTFVVSYPFLASPRTWPREGWHMWTFTLALVGLGGASITRRVWPHLVDTAGYTVIILAIYAALAVLVWQRVYLLWTATKHDRIRHEKSADTTPHD